MSDKDDNSGRARTRTQTFPHRETLTHFVSNILKQNQIVGISVYQNAPFVFHEQTKKKVARGRKLHTAYSFCVLLVLRIQHAAGIVMAVNRKQSETTITMTTRERERAFVLGKKLSFL